VPNLDEGSHLSYAVQWFSFAATALGFYVALARKELKRGRRRGSGSRDLRRSAREASG
jgi:cytochrome oxidase assembly protein ShyY1